MSASFILYFFAQKIFNISKDKTSPLITKNKLKSAVIKYYVF
ncbi:hypothetical protein NT05HA_0954 [Aggregatibacter aphrophilus NJ8700]|nr:hypothetical protein NT05HA_0954 [Aggregatibacter aphrophilus NJ8700]